jgi:uncharacterized damage-inducible protein DinB
MSLQKLMHNYAAFNLWANTTIAEWLKTKPIAFLEQEVPSSYPCIAKTVQHIAETERFWLQVLKSDNNKPSPRWSKIDCSDQEVLDELMRQSKSLSDHIGSLSEADLLGDCTLDAPWMQGTLPTYEFIQHCVNHSSYHRGQIITIGRNTGLTDPPTTDYNYYNMVVKTQLSF